MSKIDSVVTSGRGDDGTTGLLYGGPRIRKDDPKTEAYGTVAVFEDLYGNRWDLIQHTGQFGL